MATDVERLIVTLEARTKEYERALAKAQGTTVSAMRKVERSIDASAKRSEARFAKFGSAITRTLGSLGVGLSVAALSRGIGSAISEIGGLGESAAAAGVKVSELQELMSAGLTVGVGREDFVRLMGRFNDQLGTAATKGNELGRMLDGYGVKIRETNGEFRSSVEILKDIADRIKNAGSSQEQLTLATEAFGRGGAKIVPLLQGGREEIERLAIRAHEVGDVIDDSLVAAADRFDDAWNQTTSNMATRFKAAIVDIVATFERLGTAADQLTLDQLERDAKSLQRALNDALVSPFEGSADVAADLRRQLREIEAQMDAIRNKGPLLPTVDGGQTGAFQTKSTSVPGANGPINVRVTSPIALQPKDIEEGTRPLATAFDRSLTTYDEHGRAITAEARRTADGVRDIPPGFDRLGDRFHSALGVQTGALVSALDSGFKRTAGTTGDGPGAFGGSLGSSSSLTLQPNAANQARLDLLGAEAQSIQANLQYRQLSPEDQQAAEQRLAQIELESAKLNQAIAETTHAMLQLTPMISQMSQAGAEMAQITEAVGAALRRMTGTAPFGAYAGFADGGPVRGPGGPTSDSVPIMASAGEFVVNAASTKKHRALLDAINGDRVAGMADGGIVGRLNGAAQRLANGGMVQASPSTASAGSQVNAPVYLTVNTPDADSFRRSSREITRSLAAELQYAMHGG